MIRNSGAGSFASYKLERISVVGPIVSLYTPSNILAGGWLKYRTPIVFVLQVGPKFGR